jgi:O-antigen ligase
MNTSQLLSLRNRGNLGLLAWVAMFMSILIWTQSDLRTGELGDSTNYYRIVLVLFAAAAAVYVLLRNGARVQQAFPGPLLLLLFYGLVAMVSSIYVPTYAFYSMWKSFEILVDVFVIAAILSYVNPQDAARTAYRILPILNGILVVVYLVEAAVWPSLALTPSRGTISIYMSGVLPVMAQIALAFLSAVTAFAVFCRLYRPGRALVKLMYLPILGLSLAALIFAQSRTSVIALVLAVVVYLLFDRRFISLALLAGVCLLAAIYTQASSASFHYLLRGQDEQLVTTLSGRTEGWEAAWESFKEAPVAGRGFAAYARAHILGGTNGMSSLHGAIFDVMVGTGLLGLIPWIAAIVWTLGRVLTLPMSGHPWFRSAVGRSIQAEMLGVMVLILVRASTSSGLAMHQDNFMLFLTVLAYAASMRRAARRVSSDEEVPWMEGAKA